MKAAMARPWPQVSGMSRSPLLGSFVAFLVLVALWQVASAHPLVSSPGVAVRELYDEFSSGSLHPHLISTMRVILQGYVVAILLGFPAGLFIGIYHSWRRVLEEFCYGLTAVPKITWYPIFLVLFGIGLNTQMAYVVAGSFFPIMVTTMVGVREIQPALVRVGRSFNLSPHQMLAKVFLPSIAPSVVGGLRIGYSMAVTHALLAEMFLAREGLGVVMWRAYGNQYIDTLYGLMIPAFLLALVGNMLLWLVERRLRGRVALQMQL